MRRCADLGDGVLLFMVLELFGHVDGCARACAPCVNERDMYMNMCDMCAPFLCVTDRAVCE